MKNGNRRRALLYFGILIIAYGIYVLIFGIGGDLFISTTATFAMGAIILLFFAIFKSDKRES